MHTHLLMAITTLSFAGFSQSSRRQRPVCVLSTKPCRLYYNLQFLNGTLDTEIHTHMCSCSSPYSCSDDWSLSSHVISLKEATTTHDITVNMMFCQAFQPPRECNIGEQALVMSGPAMANNIVSFNCRCSDSTPLLLKEWTREEDILYQFRYVCNSQMPTCPRSQSHCSTLLSDGIRYNCKCPGYRYCGEAEPDAGGSGHGFCQH